MKSRNDASRAEFQEIFNQDIKEHPDHVQAYIEQCKFLERSSHLGEDEAGEPEKVEACLTELLKRFPNDPRVVLYRASRLFGQEKVIYLEENLRGKSGSWPREALADGLEALAWSHYHLRQFDRAGATAQKALALDSKRDLHLILAVFFQSNGRIKDALAVLRKASNDNAEDWVLQTTARLFCELGSFQDARAVFQKLEASKNSFVDKLQYAQALQECGEYALARQKLREASKWIVTRPAVYRTLFLLDLKHGDGPTALASYNALRDCGIGVDPFLRYRMALALKYPAGAWSLRDLGGILALCLGVLSLFALPALWIAPVHYVGLLRRRATAIERKRPLQWNLSHFWAISSIALFASGVVLVTSSYRNITPAQVTPIESGMIGVKAHLAKITILIFPIMSAGTLLLMRRRHWRLLCCHRWSVLKTLLYSGVLFVFLRMIAQVCLGAGSDNSSFGADFVRAGMRFEVPSVGEILLAIYRSYGVGTLIVVAVILVPFYEEFIFRGIILDSCERHLSFHAANVLQATAFAIGHQQLKLFPFFFCFGLIGGFLRRESGGLLAPILIHMANNLIVTLALLSAATP